MARGQHVHVIKPPRRSVKEKLYSSAFFVEEITIFLSLFALIWIMYSVRHESELVWWPTMAVCLLSALLLPLVRGRVRLIVLRSKVPGRVEGIRPRHAIES